MVSRPTALLLNLAHALDHLFLLIFAAAVAKIAVAFGFDRWEDLMPFGVGMFFLFGLGALPAGRLGDLWGRRPMMLVFFFGIGAASLLAATTQTVWQLGAALTLIGVFASIYHPVGIPMLVQAARHPGATIGINGLAGNLGVAAAALVTGLLVDAFGWRAAFIVPGLFSIACGAVFARVTARETEAPARRARQAAVALPRGLVARAFFVMTAAAVTGSLLFNFTTNGNGPLIAERLRGLVDEPATLGVLLAGIYAVASFAQVIVGRLIDRYPLKPLYLGIALAQAPVLWLAAHSSGWPFYALLTLAMVLIFGAIPFTDAMIVRYVDDRMRSRVAGMRLAVSFSISSGAVWLLGPVVKAGGFSTLLVAMAIVALCTSMAVLLLPNERQTEATARSPLDLTPRAGS